MSADIEGGGGMMSHCASCGVKDGDDIKLKDCSACHLVKYCGVNCQKHHRKKHKRACKQRAAELYDELLFKQPESSCYGDCPLCFFPLPLDQKLSFMKSCCGKIICHGCYYTYQEHVIRREIVDKVPQTCPFCRRLAPKSDIEGQKRRKARAEMNDPVALCYIGATSRDKGDYKTALQYLSKGAELGDAESQHNLAVMYDDGLGVVKDKSKAVHHYEQAAIGGNPKSRHNLAVYEWENGRRDRAVKHLIIGAKLGFDESLDALQQLYKNGLVSKENFEAALCGHQAAVDATKSPDRDEMDAFAKKHNIYS